jgi:CRISPR-associated protein Csm2
MGYSNYNNYNQATPAPKPPVITQENYYDKAGEVIKTLKTDKFGKYALTTSQIRNLLAMVNEIYNDLIAEENVDKERFILKVNKLKTRMTYEIGRKNEIKDFMNKSGLLDMATAEKSKFMLFHNYFEALVAFHKFYGGKD